MCKNIPQIVKNVTFSKVLIPPSFRMFSFYFCRKSSFFSVVENHENPVFPKSSPRLFFGIRKCGKKLEKHRISYEIRCFYGCGGRTRTYDLRVMSPTSFQLLYSAILCASALIYNITHRHLCQPFISENPSSGFDPFRRPHKF